MPYRPRERRLGQARIRATKRSRTNSERKSVTKTVLVLLQILVGPTERPQVARWHPPLEAAVACPVSRILLGQFNPLRSLTQGLTGSP